MPPVTRKTRAAASNLEPLITFGEADTLILETLNRRSRPRKAKLSKVWTSQREVTEQPSVVADLPSSSAKPGRHRDTQVSENHNTFLATGADQDTSGRAEEPTASVETPDTPPGDARELPARAEWEPLYRRGLREFCNPTPPGARRCYDYLSSSSQDSDSEEETPRDRLYREIGYLPPLSDSELELIRRVRRYPNMNRNGDRINPSKEKKFADGLTKRNVGLLPSPDPAFRQHLETLESTARGESADEKSAHSRTWLLDLKKACADKLEVLFQRTVLMSIIDRHRLVHYQEGNDSSRDPYLDFAVERPWTCPPMPSRVFQEPVPQTLSQPKPDLAVAFRREDIFPSHLGWSRLPLEMQEVACYEENPTMPRVFHFLTIEAKNSDKGYLDNKGLLQSLNNSSQSLHNMYELFREAGDEHVKIFFDKVRVFSAVASCDGIVVRVHRPVPVASPEDVQEANFDKFLPVVEGYPLGFTYTELFVASQENHAAKEYTRDNVVGLMEDIIVGYGIGELRGHLQRAAREFMAKCFRFEADNCGRPFEREEGYYSHGCLPQVATTNQRIRGVSRLDFRTTDKGPSAARRGHSKRGRGATTTSSGTPTPIQSRKRRRTSTGARTATPAPAGAMGRRLERG